MINIFNILHLKNSKVGHRSVTGDVGAEVGGERSAVGGRAPHKTRTRQHTIEECAAAHSGESAPGEESADKQRAASSYRSERAIGEQAGEWKTKDAYTHNVAEFLEER